MVHFFDDVLIILFNSSALDFHRGRYLPASWVNSLLMSVNSTILS